MSVESAGMGIDKVLRKQKESTAHDMCGDDDDDVDIILTRKAGVDHYIGQSAHAAFLGR